MLEPQIWKCLELIKFRVLSVVLKLDQMKGGKF